jgi:hypothetical protein
MADDELYVCLFCASDIKPSDDAMTVPNLGVLVHTACYRRERGDSSEELEKDR